MIPQQAREASSNAMDRLAINTIRTLAIDGVQKANSGHPGTPLGAAPTAYAIWQHELRYDPQNPWWPNRDRFVLSAGHASMLLYALIHLTGVKAANASYKGEDRLAVTLDDLKTFRQEGSRCPGHPEYGWTTGVEATTGPLGQGISNSVGMAIAGKWLAATYNRPGFDLFDFNVYALCGDGCLMEGVASEAASLAAHLKLSNLCWIYDCNHVTIEGHTDLAFTEDVASRFMAYGWDVARVSDPNDVEQVDRALDRFKSNERPTLIVVHSHIGYGAPHKQDTSAAHGEPLGAEEVRLTKEFFGFSPDQSFVVPDGVREHFAAGMGARGAKLRQDWDDLFARYKAQYPDLADDLQRMHSRDLPAGWEKALPTFPASPSGMSTRDASGKVLNAVAQKVPWLLGGAADLYPSTKTRLEFEFAGDFEANHIGNYKGRNFHFGIREHAMIAIVNGMVLSGLRAFGSGFLIFTDYARGAIRLSSLMDIPALHIWTHDTISLGEDGPTHQPIEQLVSLRAIPGMMVIRPADANEMVEAYRLALSSKDRPYAIICSRQALPIYDRTKVAPASGVAKGGYVLADAADGKPEVILIGCGSEVGLCMKAWEQLTGEGVKARVVSMPSWPLFDKQDQAYRESVLPPAVVARVAVEEASPIGWHRFVGSHGKVLGMNTFGESAPIKVVMEHFGFTVEHVVAAAKEVMKGN
ncbi:MAG TPA: transketolase [Bryocella sp.]|nr:transketolase [Bryocella sp.]